MSVKRTVIGLKGASGQGKSEVIKILRSLLETKYEAPWKIYIDGPDIKLIFIINGIRIALESQGDPKSRQQQSIGDFIAANCDLIICACRTSGQTARSILTQEITNIE